MILRWSSEKYDGIRAYWDGEKLYSKNGVIVKAPAKFTEGLPSIPLDGELWMGRGSLSKLMSVHISNHGDWSDVEYIVFDLPNSKEPYEQRLEELKKLLPKHVRKIQIQKCVPFSSSQHLNISPNSTQLLCTIITYFLISTLWVIIWLLLSMLEMGLSLLCLTSLVGILWTGELQTIRQFFQNLQVV